MKVDDKWIKNKSDELAVDEGCFFDIKYADKVKFFGEKFLRHFIDEWAGKPFTLLPFQWEEIIAPMYGWRNTRNEKRWRQISVWMGKNNGKSCLGGLISAFELVGANKPAAQVVNIASDEKQANIVFGFCCNMLDPSLVRSKQNPNGRLWIRPNIKQITYEATKSSLKVMSGTDKAKRGFQLSALVFDEISEQNNRILFDSMYNNVKKRKDAFVFTCSTASYRSESIGKELFDYANKVAKSQILDTTILPVVYAADPDDLKKWDSIDVFRKANPASGVTIDEEEVRKTIVECQNEPRKKASYLVERLNLWCGYGSQWISDLAWNACKTHFNEEDFWHGSEPVFLGLDYAYKHDLCAYVLVLKRNDKVYVMPRFFINRQDALRKQEQDRVPYLSWAEDPRCNLFLTDGDVIDPAFVRQKIKEDCNKFNVVEIGFDEKGWEESRQIAQQEIGIPWVAVRQNSKSLGGAAGFLERSILAKSICVPFNPILDWCLSNTAARETADGLYLTKGNGETQRFDGIIATCISLNRFLARDQNVNSDYVIRW